MDKKLFLTEYGLLNVVFWIVFFCTVGYGVCDIRMCMCFFFLDFFFFFFFFFFQIWNNFVRINKLSHFVLFLHLEPVCVIILMDICLGMNTVL